MMVTAISGRLAGPATERPKTTLKPAPHPSISSPLGSPEPARKPGLKSAEDRDHDVHRPLKLRRLGDKGGEGPSTASRVPKLEIATPLRGEGPSSSSRPGHTEKDLHRHVMHTPISLDKGKGRARNVEGPSSTPMNATGGQRPLEDYSAFKGRGRYAQDANS